MLIFFLCLEGQRYVFSFFFLPFLRPTFRFPCNLFIRLSIGTVSPGRLASVLEILSSSNEKPEVNMVIFVMFRGSMWPQMRKLVCFRHLRFELLLLVLNRDRYFYLVWLQFGISNPAKRGHVPTYPVVILPGKPSQKPSYCKSGKNKEKPCSSQN